MKLYFTLILILIPIITFSQSSYADYSNGYQVGYKEGYCYEDFSCIPPNPPNPPNPNAGYDRYQDGYNRGFKDGQAAKLKKSSGSQRSSGGGNQTLIEGAGKVARSSGGYTDYSISDESSAAMGQAMAVIIIQNQIKNAKRDLRSLPSQYNELPLLLTAFDIGNAIEKLINYEIKPNTQEEYQEAVEALGEKYIKSVLKEELEDKFQNHIATYDLYDGSWKEYKKENKEVAKLEEKQLKDYLKKNK